MASLILDDRAVDVEGSFSPGQSFNGDKSNDLVDETVRNSSQEPMESSSIEVSNHDLMNGTEKQPEAREATKEKENFSAQFQDESKQTKPAGEYQGQVGENNLNSAEEIANLRKQLQRSITAQSASDERITELQAAVISAEKRAKEASMELVEAQKKMDEEVKTRDKRYTELDVKFGKLQKRAKQRIQELQKEKEDAEVKLAAASEKASQALSQCASLQNDLERVRAQAGDALRSLDAERQQLRSTTYKQKEVIDDLQRKLEAIEEEQKEAHRVASEKEQVVNELTDKMMEMEKNQGTYITDQISKHQKSNPNFSAAPMASGEGQSNPSTTGDASGDHNEDYGNNEYGPPLPTQEELCEMEHRRLVGEATNMMLNFAKDPNLAKYMTQTTFQDVHAQWKATTTSPQNPDNKKQYSEKELEEEVEARP
ncbi:hypothetical protein L7F22_021208 [Adiantum nelumboides]|nr:hypothetical protein [Adiantum nelumboides]